MDYDDAEVSIRVKLPGGKVEIKTIIIPWSIWEEEGLSPLPKDHDNPLLSYWARHFSDRLRLREQGIGFIARHLSLMFTRIIRDQDPVRGYSPEERSTFPT